MVLNTYVMILLVLAVHSSDLLHKHIEKSVTNNTIIVTEGYEEFIANLNRTGWSRADSGLDLRISRSMGPKGYNSLRMSVITQSPTSFSNFSPSYAKQFQYRWTNNWLYSKEIQVVPGMKLPFSINGVSFNIKLPKQGSGTRGILFGDPCLVANDWCRFAGTWQTWSRGTNFLNEVMKDDNMDFWFILGDNFYDQSGSLTKQWFQSLTLETKSKITGMILGNHDMWINGSPGSGSYNDQFGIGMMQWYATDSAASLNNDFFDFSRNPNNDRNYHGTPNTATNMIWWNIIGNVGFLGYNGAYTMNDYAQYFDQACDYFSSNKPSWVFLFGHWNGRNLGCQNGMDTPNVFNTLKNNRKCTYIKNKLKYFDGHEHCNWKTGGDDGFLIGANGMHDGACDKGMWGYLYVKTNDDGHLQLWYFEINNGSTRRDIYNQLMDCIQKNGSLDNCTYLATKWFDSSPSPGPDPTPSPPSNCCPEGKDPWATGREQTCCPNTKKCLKDWNGPGKPYNYLCVDCNTGGCVDNSPCIHN